MTFTDNFTGTSGDLLDSRTGWSLVGSEGAYQAQIYTDGATLQCRTTGSGSGATTYACTDQGTADHYVTYKRISFTSSSANEVCVRYVDGSNYLSHRLAGTGSSGSRLSKVVSGTRTELIQVQGAANDVNKIECSGSDVSFFINGTQQGSTQTVTDHQSETTAALIFGTVAAVSFYDDYETGALGTTTPEDSAPLSGTGEIVAAGAKIGSSAAPVNATAAIESTWLKIASSAAPLAGAGEIVAAGEQITTIPESAAPLAGSATITAAGAKIARAPPSLTSAASVTAVGAKTAFSAAPLAGAGEIVAAGENPENAFSIGSITVEVLKASTTYEVIKATTTYEVV